MAGGGGGDGGRRGSDRCVALVSSGHRRLRPGLLQDVANLPDSPEPLSRSSRDCHSLATTPPQLGRVSRACRAASLQLSTNRHSSRARDRSRWVAALRGWGPAFSNFSSPKSFSPNTELLPSLLSWKTKDSLINRLTQSRRFDYPFGILKITLGPTSFRASDQKQRNYILNFANLR